MFIYIVSSFNYGRNLFTKNESGTEMPRILEGFPISNGMDYLINIITDVGYWGYAVIFLIIFLESFPPTFFLPGDSLLFLTGFMASAGHFNIFLLIATFFVASVLGYMFSYAMGQKIRDIIMRSNDKYWFKIKHLQYTEEFYRKYGSKTIIISRFVPVVRSFSPTLAGAVVMNYRVFTRNSIIGALLWAGVITLAGFYLGRIIPGADRYLSFIVFAVIFVSLLPAIAEFLRNKMKK